MSTRTLPLRGAANPSSLRDGTNPGSFANAPNLGGALTFSSPDTPGMPGVLTPDTASPGALSATWNQNDGSVCGTCGSPASTAPPPATFPPFTAQALESGYS